ncbi:hypothetical protein [Bacillus toyonensis]|uniref:hypothetical protein n=1 Tax=Bacillus toyonensis TaxID=155322 RepID=UPI00156DC023|nr:hypothetical protein [Bacillus toyonensis]NSL68291.1 hypothetical protein [Bacillus toyonensis]
MDKITLTHEQYLSFTGWSERHALKQTVTDRIDRLTKMGMQEVTTNGRGKNATYTFIIPSEFWRLLLIPFMSYTAVGADYINYLLEGKDVLNTQEGIIVRFSTEIIQELAEIHNVDIEAVKTTCRRIRKHLTDCSYIRLDMPESVKSHRVKETRDGGWMTGEKAFKYDQQARVHWTHFFHTKLAQYQEIEPTATKVPMYIFGAEAKRIYQVDMARWLEVEYYRVAKRTYITDNLTNDINYARQVFLETCNLSQVREELAHRQEQYKLEKLRRDEQKQLEKRQQEELAPSREEKKEIRERINEVVKSGEFVARMRTTEEQEEHDKLISGIDAFLNLCHEEAELQDNE